MSGQSAASTTDEINTNYVGVSYDPRTAEITGDASARLNDKNEFLKGNIKVDGDVIPVNQKAGAIEEHPITGDQVSRFGAIKKSKFENGSVPVRMKIHRVKGADISGIFFHSTGSEQTAFRIRDIDNGESEEAIKSHHRTDPEGEN